MGGWIESYESKISTDGNLFAFCIKQNLYIYNLKEKKSVKIISNNCQFTNIEWFDNNKLIYNFLSYYDFNTNKSTNLVPITSNFRILESSSQELKYIICYKSEDSVLSLFFYDLLENKELHSDKNFFKIGTLGKVYGVDWFYE